MKRTVGSGRGRRENCSVCHQRRALQRIGSADIGKQMVPEEHTQEQQETSKLERVAPGIALFRTYDRAWLRPDLTAGLAVAATTVPVALAYAQLAGLQPVTGLYASILPLVAYALFGTSRQLIVGPDSATAALVAATLAPIAAGDPAQYAVLSAALAIITGLLCIAGGMIKLGFLADFLAKPILTGYLNGIAIVIIAGQMGKLFGYSVEAQGFFRLMADFLSKLGQTHLPTLTVALAAFAVLLLFKLVLKSPHGPLVVVVGAIVAVMALDLQAMGVKVVGEVPGGFPSLGVPQVIGSDVSPLVLGSFGILLISFTNLILPSRSFAAKNHYSIDANREFTALGAANLAAGFSQSFAISGSASRTAVNDSVGGKTQLVQCVAALAVALVLLFLTGPLSYLPTAVLGAVLVVAVAGLFDFATLRWLRRVAPYEFRLALLTTLGVITVGILPGVLAAVGLALILLLVRASRPHDAVLGLIPGTAGFHDVHEFPDAKPIPGMLVYRYDAALLSFNADYFRSRLLDAASQAHPSPAWVVLDAEALTMIDSTGLDVLKETIDELENRGMMFAVARVRGQFREKLWLTGLAERIGQDQTFATVTAAADSYRRRMGV